MHEVDYFIDESENIFINFHQVNGYVIKDGVCGSPICRIFLSSNTIDLVHTQIPQFKMKFNQFLNPPKTPRGMSKR